MLPSHHWVHNFTVEAEDIEHLINILLEKETPLTTYNLASLLVSHRLETAQAALEAKYKDVIIYDPASSYKTGQQLVFPQFDLQTATVTDIRVGSNPDYGNFDVISVRFDKALDIQREFASNLQTAHTLIGDENANDLDRLQLGDDLTVEDILDLAGEKILNKVEQKLEAVKDIVRISRTWFPYDLMIVPDEGHLNLTEAVLDMAGGGPLNTQDIIEQIGGLGTESPLSLQEFSLNYVLKNDSRFEEVGPVGEILWFLARLEPDEVQNMPHALRYTPIEYDRSLLLDIMRDLEEEINDELSPLTRPEAVDTATLTLTYPHRRTGTLPLNRHSQHIFPSAESTTHIWLTLVDAQDGEEFVGWVIPKDKYVFGLGSFYSKHHLPIGAYITLKRGDTPEKVIVDFDAYRPRTEWVTLILPKKDQIQFENQKRPIGAEYDDLMIMGVDDLDALDTVIQTIRQQKRSLASILKMIVPNLSQLTPQGTAHLKTIYSAVNILRRCPPGPIMATLEANPDFENVGGHYWKLTET